MALTDLPTIKGANKTSLFLIALPIVIFIFFFTQDKDVSS